MPFALVIDDTTNLPLRQLQFDQRHRGIGPGARLNQPLEPRRFLGGHRDSVNAKLTKTLRQQAAGLFLQVHQLQQTNPVRYWVALLRRPDQPERKVFSGWMLASSPSDLAERILQPVLENACRYGSTHVHVSIELRLRTVS